MGSVAKGRTTYAVFDRGHRRTDVRKAGFTLNAQNVGFHRTATDRREPRGNVTAQMMGDPRPGRSAQDALDGR